MIGFVAGLLALAPTPAVPVADVPAPIEVTVAWETPRQDQRVLITWKETGDQRNRIDVINADGTPTSWQGQIVEAGQPNQHVWTGWTRDGDFRVQVRAIDAEGNPLSEAGVSVAFDTDRPSAPVMKTAVPREDGSVAITWAAGVPYTDDNPGDPLDLPAAEPPQYIPLATIFNFNEFEDAGTPTTATSAVVAKRDLPARYSVRSVANEWGYQAATESLLVWGSKISATIPKKAETGKPLKVTGKAIRVQRACDPGPCGQIDLDDPNRLVRLEARTGANDDWESVATVRTAANGTFTLQVTSPGTRQYRVVAPVVLKSGEQDAMGYAATGVTTTKAVAAAGGGDTGGTGGGGLAITGTPVGLIAAIGGLLVALGAVFMLTGRRRRRA
ncbi:MAG: hypothetical protein ABW022_01710 [Actinoplanes sp.]